MEQCQSMGSTEYSIAQNPRPCIPDKFYIPHCVYHGKPCHRLWRFKLDIYGYCVQELVLKSHKLCCIFDAKNSEKYNPDNGEKANKKISVGRQTSLRRVSFKFLDLTFFKLVFWII